LNSFLFSYPVWLLDKVYFRFEFFISKILSSCSRDAINKVYLEASLGNITSLELWDMLEVSDKDNYSKIEKLYLDTYLTLDEQFVEVAKRLRNDYNLAILSNDVSEWGSYLREKHGINDFVDVSIISGDVGCRKPSSDIYKIALERLGAESHDCIFIDDRDKNLVPAKEMGMQVIRFLRDDSDCKLEGVKTINSFMELEERINAIT